MYKNEAVSIINQKGLVIEEVSECLAKSGVLGETSLHVAARYPNEMNRIIYDVMFSQSNAREQLFRPYIDTLDNTPMKIAMTKHNIDFLNAAKKILRKEDELRVREASCPALFAIGVQVYQRVFIASTKINYHILKYSCTA